MKMTVKEQYLLDCLENIAETSSESSIANFAEQAIYISGSFPEEESIVEEYEELVDELLECYRSEEPPSYNLYERFWGVKCKMRTYKGFLKRFNKVIDILNETLEGKTDKDYTKEDLFLIAKCNRYLSRSYLKMAKVNSTLSAGSGFSFNDIDEGE